ncbi:ABC transporter permease [Vulgatibacter sp.]|uniref:ABC transporter permease n=1 Tax=Vulgatibacter sp. TaxID=1971226 RepID=UPI00356940C5
MGGISLGLLLRIAMRSLVGHRIKGLIVGTILAFGTFLVVLGTTLLDNVERSMEESITGSLTGHIQLVSKNAKDELAFFGPAAASDQDLSVIADYDRVKKAMLALDNVEAVIPMGRQMAQGVVGNELDENLEALREAVRAEDESRVADLSGRVKRMVSLLLVEQQNAAEIASDPAELEEGIGHLRRGSSDAFWADFGADPIAALEFLDTKVAPLSTTSTAVFLPYIATDLDAYAEKFEHFEIADGEMVPRGHKGFLFNKTYFEEQAKNKVARHLDKIQEAIELDGKTIAGDPLLQEQIERGKKQTRHVTQQLGPADAVLVEAELRKLLPEVKGDLDALLTTFLDVDDANFAERYAFFYEVIAPRVRLYRVKVGDTVTIRALSQDGYMRAINVKVYGTFKLKGLERSVLASVYNLVDLMSFRDLYGLMTPEKRKELDAIRADVGVADIDRASAEDALFGGDEEMVVEADLAGGTIDVDAALAAAASAQARATDTFDPADLERGMTLHAALLLKDPARLTETMAAIEKASDEQDLGVRPFTWQQVAGIVGQFILVMRVVLYVAIAIIFAVALVIINNSMVMATMDRVGEIGTMRAIGARRRFVLTLFLLETLVLALIAGGVGAAAASGLIVLLGNVGIPSAGNDGLIFLFGGPALHPELVGSNLVLGLAAIVTVSLVSTLYPARIAARIAPVVAMQSRE